MTCLSAQRAHLDEDRGSISCRAPRIITSILSHACRTWGNGFQLVSSPLKHPPYLCRRCIYIVTQFTIPVVWLCRLSACCKARCAINNIGDNVTYGSGCNLKMYQPCTLQPASTRVPGELPAAGSASRPFTVPG